MLRVKFDFKLKSLNRDYAHFSLRIVRANVHEIKGKLTRYIMIYMYKIM